jgi:hypothetical protein
MESFHSGSRFLAAAALALGFLPALAAVPPESPYLAPQAPFYGQVRTRTEYDIKGMADTGSKKGLLNTQLRTRLGFVAAPSPAVEIKVEVQDMRYYGQEPNAAGNPSSATVGRFRRLVFQLQRRSRQSHGPGLSRS